VLRIETADANPFEPRSKPTDIRRRAWLRALEARGAKVPDTLAEAVRRFPDTALAIEKYVHARDRSHTDRERRAAKETILDPHCAELARRSLAAQGLPTGRMGHNERLARAKAKLAAALRGVRL